MQKLPKFGERLMNFDSQREEESWNKLKEFLTRTKKIKKQALCEEVADYDSFKILKDTQGLSKSFGTFMESCHYISPEEAFYLSSKKIINVSPITILMNTQVFIQKILLYSYFKRKGLYISVNETSLFESLNKNFGFTKKRRTKNDENSIKIVNPDETCVMEEGEFYIYKNGVFDKIKIELWASHELK